MLVSWVSQECQTPCHASLVKVMTGFRRGWGHVCRCAYVGVVIVVIVVVVVHVVDGE